MLFRRVVCGEGGCKDELYVDSKSFVSAAHFRQHCGEWFKFALKRQDALDKQYALPRDEDYAKLDKKAAKQNRLIGIGGGSEGG